MLCDRFARRGALREEQGLGPDAHTASCPECQRARAAYQASAETLAERSGAGPAPGWQERVWAQVDAQTARPRRRWRWLALGLAPLVALACLAYLYSSVREEKRMHQVELRQMEERRLAAERELARTQRELEVLRRALERARTEGERVEIQQRINRLRHTVAPEGPSIQIDDTNDPLHGAK
jgi:hypothetical protein